jgi:glycosyltransferase involved in cell wall biosynthesis
MRVHIPSLPHTQVTRAWDHCAYTAKVRRLSGMLASRGHEPITYCGTQFEGTGEHVVVVEEQDRNDWWGGIWDRHKVFDEWDPAAACWRGMNHRTIDAIKDRWEPGDAVGIIAGRCQQQIADTFTGHLVLEWGIGYEGILPNTLHCFESETWRHYVYGQTRIADGRHFDTVIPNAFDPDDYTTGDDDGYLLFLGRHTHRKGVEIVKELAKTYKVVTAGQDGPLEGIEYRGIVLGDEKAELLAHATAVLVPTLYIEPFGGVAVEAMMSGVPAVTTNFGAFTETVQHGLTGFRCDTLGEFHQAIDDAPSLRGSWVRDLAVASYGVKAVAGRYDAWLRRCALLEGDGWYSTERPF